MMNMEQRQSLKQTQQLVLTQKMQQALHILQLSTTELEQHIQQELEANPFLEVRQKENEVPETPGAENVLSDQPATEDVAFDLDNYVDKWDIRRREGQDLSFNKDLHARREYYENSITQNESLRAHLLNQMRLSTEDETTYAIGERIIIGDIDERGYFTGDEASIAEELEVPEESVCDVLDLIQHFEPTGVGAHDMTECLLLQIEAEYPAADALKTLVRDHMDALTHRQIPKIAKAMGLTTEQVEHLKNLLATLNPWPGHSYTTEPPHYIAADVVVEKIDDEFVVHLAEDSLPEMTINQNYYKLVREDTQNKEDKGYIRARLEAAKGLQQHVAQRRQTILKVSSVIMEVQQEFLEKGVEFIRPLTLQNIADVVGVHESTIARATRGKYIQTPQGLFELKYFFSPGLSTDGGEDQSSKSVKALIKKMIDNEDKRKPLSDQKIVNALKENEGIQIARRTVTKYREALGILKTSLRREY